MRNSIAYLMIFRNHVRFYVRKQIGDRRFESFEERAAEPSCS